MTRPSPSSVVDTAYRLRKIAESGPIGKRHSSLELYELLAGCMALAERCRNDDANAELRRLVAQQPRTGNRRYVERQSDEYSLVCRFVFSDLRSAKAERSNASRYAHALRQAAISGLTSATLVAKLATDGGINNLFLRRPLSAANVTTRSLQLDRPITVEKGRPFCLTLRRTTDNRYEVLDHSDDPRRPRNWGAQDGQP